jgi:homoserine kinase type II
MAGYTLLTEKEIARLLSCYDLGELLESEPMKGGQANSSYKVTTGRGAFILSVCDEKNEKEIALLTSLLAHLRQYGFPTSNPVPTLSGSLMTGHENKPVYLKEYIGGGVKRQLSEAMLYQVGQAVSTLHSIPSLKNLGNRFPYGLDAFEEMTDLEHPYIDWLTKRASFLHNAIDPELSKTLIHGDIYWDNLLFSDNELVAVLDFEEACNYYSLYDLGVCAVGCCSENNQLNMEQIQTLLRGYQQDHLLSGHEKEQLKVFIEYAGVAGSFWRFRQYNVRYPSPQMKDSYKELSALADQVHNMDKGTFLEFCAA